MRQKPVVDSRLTPASTPPATATSHRPAASRSRASARAVAPEAQAVAGARPMPRAPRSMETSPVPRLGRTSGMARGETKSGPRSSRRLPCSSHLSTQPMPQPRIVATRAPSQSAGR